MAASAIDGSSPSHERSPERRLPTATSGSDDRGTYAGSAEFTSRRSRSSSVRPGRTRKGPSVYRVTSGHPRAAPSGALPAKGGSVPRHHRPELCPREQRGRSIHVDADFAGERPHAGPLYRSGKRVAGPDELPDRLVAAQLRAPGVFVPVQRRRVLRVDLAGGDVGGAQSVQDAAAGEGLRLAGGVADEEAPFPDRPVRRADRDRPRTPPFDFDAVVVDERLEPPRRVVARSDREAVLDAGGLTGDPPGEKSAGRSGARRRSRRRRPLPKTPTRRAAVPRGRAGRRRVGPSSGDRRPHRPGVTRTSRRRPGR